MQVKYIAARKVILQMNYDLKLGIYKHFKGNKYRVLGKAENTETREIMVIYMALYGDFKIYVRPYEMFMSQTDKEKYPDSDQKLRFEWILD